MKKGILAASIEQFWQVPPVATADLTGQTVIVTGANTGLGYETAKHLAKMGVGKLILACRSETKGKQALSELKNETGFEAGEVWILDQSKFSSVVAFVERFEKEGGGRLDILVANAGMMNPAYNVTEDGYEEMLQVNDLSTSLLCLLAPHLVETGKKYGTHPRIVIVSSDTHYWVTLPDKAYEAPSSFRYLSSTEYCTPSVIRFRYLETKLLNIFFMQSLSALLKDTPVIVNAVTPGYCYSSLNRNVTGLLGVLDSIRKRLLGRSTEEGARQIVYGAVGRSDDPKTLRGAYLCLHNIQEPSDHTIGDDGKRRRDKLWHDLLEELSVVDTGRRLSKVIQAYST